MISKRSRRPGMPELNTSALPDLIFTVLFFFMIATHMRTISQKVDYRTPEGTEIRRLTRKSSIAHIYIGKDKNKKDSGTIIQLNNDIVPLNDLTKRLIAERNLMSEDDRAMMTVSVKADRDTRMAIINKVKDAIRQANIRRISFSATKEGKR